MRRLVAAFALLCATPLAAEELVVGLSRTMGEPEPEWIHGHGGDGDMMTIELTRTPVTVRVRRHNDVEITDADWEEIIAGAMLCEGGFTEYIEETRTADGGTIRYYCLVEVR